jgi:OmcA/MtrC family decaheme c-type cytochrome
VVCHNPNTEVEGNPAGGGFDNVAMVNMIHKIHINPARATALGWTKTPGDGAIVHGIDISVITYPQDIRNCTTCHQGGSDSDNWKTRPTIFACTSCHATTTFGAGATHTGGAQVDGTCGTCHPPDTGGFKAVAVAHADNTATPGNVPPGLDNIAFFLDNVTVDSNSFPVVTFRVTKNGTPVTFNTFGGGDNAAKLAFVNTGLLTGYTGSPSFLVAFAANQDGINPVADYNNLGNGTDQGQPAVVSVAEIFLNDNNAGTIVSGPDGSGNYTVKLFRQVGRNSTGAITSTFSAQYPPGAYMRAVGLQGRVRQVVGGVQVARPATSVVKPVTPATGTERVRRTVVDKNSCLECHEQLALHGSNRVNEVQLCVMCHNPNLGEGGAKSVNFKDLIHAIHSGTTAYPPWSETRGTTGTGWANIRYPGELTHCTKCHYGTPAANTASFPNSYKADLPDGVLLSTNSVMGVAPAPTDNVVSPTAAACGRCHSSSEAIDHFKLQGGDVGVPRADALVVAPPTSLAPDVLATP